MHAAHDDDPDTRDEALVGLARRDRAVALDILEQRLRDGAGVVLLEAAAILADPRLVPVLREMEQWEGGDADVRERLQLALRACETGVKYDTIEK